MCRLERIVVQLEESKRFILNDTEPHLRMALLLLDNAAEVLMHRKIKDELWHDKIYARMQAKYRNEAAELGPDRWRRARLRTWRATRSPRFPSTTRRRRQPNQQIAQDLDYQLRDRKLRCRKRRGGDSHVWSGWSRARQHPAKRSNSGSAIVSATPAYETRRSETFSPATRWHRSRDGRTRSTSSKR
jgi:hypothetical protein